jgi:hypothetical protein
MIFNFIGKSIRNMGRVACSSLFALALVSCGGGGGSAGTVPGSATTSSTATVSATSLVLALSSPQLVAASTTGVTVTATAEDANHNPVIGVAVTFTASSGLLTPAIVSPATTAVTNSSGVATAILTTTTVTPATITVTASGGGQSVNTTVSVVGAATVAPSIALLFSSPTLASAGISGTEVTVTAQLLDVNNNALVGIPVTFSTDSGILVVTQATSNASGLATATLGTAENPVNRVINVTASTAGATPVKGTVNVTGTTVTASTAPTALTVGVLSKFTFNVQDSSGKNIPNAAITFSSAASNTVVPDPLDAGMAAAPVTDANGNVTLDVTPKVAGQGTLTVNSEGANTKSVFTTTSQSLSVTLTDNTTTSPTVVSVVPQPLEEYTSTSCVQVSATYTVGGAPSVGTALVSTSRGTLYTDPSCTTAFSNASAWQFNTAGLMAPLYLSSITPGTATVTVSEITGAVSGPAQTASVTFIAQLTSAATPSISLTAAPSLVAPNVNAPGVNPQAQFSVLTATVRDGTSNNNLVQGVSVQFSLVSDSSGGVISPSLVVTQSNGQAQTTYYPGTGTTAQNGVQVLATVQSATSNTASKQIPLTVSGQAQFVTLGTGNTITSSDTTYSQDWAVFVTDTHGNPVQGATVIGELVASNYTKGIMAWTGTQWVVAPGVNSTVPNVTPPTQVYPPTASNTPTDGSTASGVNSPYSQYNYWCPNTDVANDGVWSVTNPPAGEQIYYPSNPTQVFQQVMPGIPGSVTASGVTNAAGYATVTVSYPKDHAYWTNVVLTVTSSTTGTQSSTSAAIMPLEGVAADYQSLTTSPPGATSPYGVNNCVTAF